MIQTQSDPRSAISTDVWEHWLPARLSSSFDWINENCRAPNGAAFDAFNFPWARGVFDAFDDPYCREIVMMWASRLGKTFIAHCLLLCGWKINPMPSMFGSSTESLATTIVREKLYPMIENCLPLASQLKSEARRSNFRIDLHHCHCRTAWSGSEAALADFGAFYMHANEIDKWTSDTSREADPLELFTERAKEFPDHKMILESTPATKGQSRVEPRYLASTQRLFFVPCPLCGTYQALNFGEEEPGVVGLVWDKGPDGHSDPDRAYATARYICAHCQGEIWDDHRARMIRSGIWVPKGCDVDRDGDLVGEASRGPRSEGFQLSSLYSLQLRWGDIARKWVTSFRRPKERQNFINSWLGKTYEITQVNLTIEQLGERMRTPYPQRVVPPNTAFLTMGIDRQQDHRVFAVVAWGPEERGHVLDYGVCQDDNDLIGGVIRTIYDDETKEKHFRTAVALYDSGFETDDVYDFCRQYSTVEQPILPCKGVDNCAGKSYRKVRLNDDRASTVKRQMMTSSGQMLVHVPNDYWQTVLQDALIRCRPGSPGCLTACTEAADDHEFLEQLLNQGRVEKRDSHGRPKLHWTVRDQDAPDDFRDALKMARCAAEMWLRCRWARVPIMLERAGTLPIPEVGKVAANRRQQNRPPTKRSEKKVLPRPMERHRSRFRKFEIRRPS